MPIHKKDRSFQNIIREVDMNEIPIAYIHSLTLVLDNGDRVIFQGDDLEEFDGTSIISFISAVSDEISDQHGASVQDLEIIVNYKKIEDEVAEKTQTLLSSEPNDKGNIGM